MNQEQKFQKKHIVLPVLLMTGIVVTSVFTTATGAAVQSLKSDINAVARDNEHVTEQVHAKTSLTLISEKIQELGFAKANTKYLLGGNTPLALR